MREVVGSDSLVRIDEKQKRFFVVRREVSRKTLEPLIEKISGCLAADSWRGRWSLSVFSERRLAGYKDDPAIIPFHQGDLWAKGYLAEYDAQTSILTLRPAISPETIQLSSPP